MNTELEAKRTKTKLNEQIYSTIRQLNSRFAFELSFNLILTITQYQLNMALTSEQLNLVPHKTYFFHFTFHQPQTFGKIHHLDSSIS